MLNGCFKKFLGTYIPTNRLKILKLLFSLILLLQMCVQWKKTEVSIMFLRVDISNLVPAVFSDIVAILTAPAVTIWKNYVFGDIALIIPRRLYGSSFVFGKKQNSGKRKGICSVEAKHRSLIRSVAPGLLAETVARLRLRLPPPASQLAHILHMSD